MSRGEVEYALRQGWRQLFPDFGIIWSQLAAFVQGSRPRTKDNLAVLRRACSKVLGGSGGGDKDIVG